MPSLLSLSVSAQYHVYDIHLKKLTIENFKIHEGRTMNSTRSTTCLKPS